MSSPPVPAPFSSLDEAVGALLDGELGPAAAEAGTTVDRLDAAIRAAPGFAASAAALTEARRALAETAHLAPLDRRRLVRRSVEGRREAAAARPPAGRILALLGAAAVALVAVLGVRALVAGSGDSDDAGGSAATSGGGEDLASFGDVSDPERLRRQLTGAAPEAGAPAAPETAGDAAGAPATGDPAVERCRGELAEDGYGDTVPLGTGTYEGRPALVFETARDGRRIVLVVAADGCAVLAAQSF